MDVLLIKFVDSIEHLCVKHHKYELEIYSLSKSNMNRTL